MAWIGFVESRRTIAIKVEEFDDFSLRLLDELFTGEEQMFKLFCHFKGIKRIPANEDGEYTEIEFIEEEGRVYFGGHRDFLNDEELVGEEKYLMDDDGRLYNSECHRIHPEPLFVICEMCGKRVKKEKTVKFNGFEYCDDCWEKSGESVAVEYITIITESKKETFGEKMSELLDMVERTHSEIYRNLLIKMFPELKEVIA